MKLHELYDRSARPPSLDSIMLAESPASPDNIWVLNEERKMGEGAVRAQYWHRSAVPPAW